MYSNKFRSDPLVSRKIMFHIKSKVPAFSGES
jgi:hypothetical protein